MASTFSTNLALELIGTGDQAGTWGVTTNTNLGTLIEQSISGYVTQAVSTGADTTITIPNGSTGVARNMYIELTGTGGASTNLIVPSNKKLYFIFNNTASGQVTVKVSGQTGVSVPNKKKMILVCNGTDIVSGANYIADFEANSLTVTNLSVTSLTATTVTASADSSFNGVSVGRGSGNISTNTRLGATALSSNTTGNSNTAVGSGALLSNTTGSNNVAVGRNALLVNTTGASNTAIGTQTLDANTTGFNNTAVGYIALGENTTGSNNVAVGWQVLGQNTTGNNNVAMGLNASAQNTTGGNNVAIGGGSLELNTTGSNNVVIGYDSGDAITTGSTNIVIGYDIDVDSPTSSNQINVGGVYFHDRLLYTERTDPAAPAINQAVVYARDNGSGKTQLCVRFNTGAVQVIATQP